MRLTIFPFIFLVFFFLISCTTGTKEAEKQIAAKATEPIEVSIPECYELANIILALTEYGLADEQEVHRGTIYYDEMLRYFEPYKNHPLLKKVNYSRELWEPLLSFRTDACAFSFGADGNIKRDFDFYANEGHKPFDDNLALVNDFAKVSKFRGFYKNHKAFYDTIIANYSSYYMIPQIKQFLDTMVGAASNASGKYKIILSPFVGRMNCHRDLDSLTVADFPDVADGLMERKSNEPINEKERCINVHTIFTEMDHGYVNPLSDQYAYEYEQNFDNSKWDAGSGYPGINCWNEYVTWALYDLFTEKYFPQYARFVNTDWHYQNASRGFFASALFAGKMKQVFYEGGKGTKLETVYQNMFGWCRETGKSLVYPQIISHKEDSVYSYDSKKDIVIQFSAPLKKNTDTLSYFVQVKDKDGVSKEFSDLTKGDFEITGNTLVLKTPRIQYPEFSVRFNWWGCRFPLLNDQGVMVAAESLVRFKQKK